MALQHPDKPNSNILDLTELIEPRPQVRLPGLEEGDPPRVFDLLKSTDLGPIEGQRIGILATDYQRLAAIEEWAEADYGDALNNLRRQVAVISPSTPPRHLIGSFHGLDTDALNSLSFQELVLTLDFFMTKTGMLTGQTTKAFQAAVGRMEQTRRQIGD